MRGEKEMTYEMTYELARLKTVHGTHWEGCGTDHPLCEVRKEVLAERLGRAEELEEIAYSLENFDCAASLIKFHGAISEHLRSIVAKDRGED
jgi:hypothetical protein